MTEQSEGDDPAAKRNRRGHGPVSPPEDEKLPGFPEAKKVKPKTSRRGGGGLRDRWKDQDGTIYEWDFQHGTVEIYGRRGKPHLGDFDPITGKQVGDPDPTRKVEP